MYKNFLLESNLVKEEELVNITNRVKILVQESVNFAEKSPNPNVQDLTKYLFVD
jgi:TPP-dependent pyruvate/acetoin dehydrogenase alpha subunit